MSLWKEGDKAEGKMKMGQRGSDKVMALVTPHASEVSVWVRKALVSVAPQANLTHCDWGNEASQEGDKE